MSSRSSEKESVIPPADWSSLQKAYGLNANTETESDHVPVCERPAFELLIGAMVVVNALVMAIELDVSKTDATHTQRLPWIITDLAFCSIFTCEIIFRVSCTGLKEFLSHMRSWGDCILVALNAVDVSIQLTGSESTGLQSFSALRILRLFKMMKIFRIVSHVKELSLIATGLVSALKSLQYVSLLLGLVIFVMAVMFRILVGRECHSDDFKLSFAYHFGTDTDPGVKCEEYWGTVLRTMYTLYQVTTLESWSQVIARPIWDVRPYYMFLILGFQLVTTFGLLNIVVAAVVDGTMNSSDELVVENQALKESESHMQILRDVFTEAADPGTGRVVEANLTAVLWNHVTRRKLLLLDISYDDPSQIFRILDSKGDGAIAVSEFVTGFMRMRGTAKSKDLLGIRAQIYRTERTLTSKIEQAQASKNSDNGSSMDAAKSLLVDVGGKLDVLSTASKEGLGRLSEDVKLHINGLAVELRGRMDSFENRLSRFSTGGQTGEAVSMKAHSESQLQNASSGTSLVSQSVPIILPTVQQTPLRSSAHDSAHGAIWQKICCTPAWSTKKTSGSSMIDLVRPTLPPIYETPELHAILSREHEQLVWQLEEKHKMLMSRINGTSPGSFSRSALPRLPDEPTQSHNNAAVADAPEQAFVSDLLEADMKLEPKENAPLLTSVSVSCASAQTDASESLALIDVARLEPPQGQGVPQVPVTPSSDAPARPETPNEVKQKVKDIARRESYAGGVEKTPLSVNKLEEIVSGPIFETVFALLITVNALIMAIEAQYWGIEAGWKINYYGAHSRAHEVWPGAEGVFFVLEMVFGAIFVIELFTKVVALRVKFIFVAWNWLDTLIVASWVMDSVFGVSTFLNPMMLRLFRLVKLLRVAKLFKSFQSFDSLSLLIHSLKASASILFWSIVVMFVLQVVAALFFCQMLQSHIADDDSKWAKGEAGRLEIYSMFGTFTRAFITMMELTLGQWGPICHALVENVSEWYAIFVVVYVLLVSFATIKVISAVFILETQKLAATDEEILIMEKERQNHRLDHNIASVFKEIDGDGTGNVNWEEFESILRDHRVVTWLSALDLEIQHCEGLFSLMDDGDGNISSKEFIQGVRRLKGAAKSVDLVNVASKQVEMMKYIKRMLDSMEAQQMLPANTADRADA